MDEIIYEASEKYYHSLELLGYQPFKQSEKLLLLSFYRDFVFHDYRGLLTKEDYHAIERALDCIWGSNCLTPYPDYLKMGKLHLGEITEIGQRMKAIENEPVLKLVHDLDSVDNPELYGDIVVIAEDAD